MLQLLLLYYDTVLIVSSVYLSLHSFQELLKTNSGNFLVCPLSVDIVLALAQFGAKGETQRQLIKGLNLPETPEKIEAAIRELTPTLKSTDLYKLDIANKVYVKEGFPISESFTRAAVDVFNSAVENVNFEQKAAAANNINGWVESKTNNRIRNLVSEDDLDENTRLVLINALYLNAKWEKQFETYATRKSPFFLTKENSVDVDTMHLVDSFNYYESKSLNAKFLELPYEGGDLSLTIVLPNERDGLSALEARANEIFATPEFTLERVSVELPKFKIESTIQFVDVLKNVSNAPFCLS